MVTEHSRAPIEPNGAEPELTAENPELGPDERAELERLRAETAALRGKAAGPGRRRHFSWRTLVSIVLIVLGHVIAVYLSHLRAGERFRTAQRALLSQYPMLVLMVLYTMTSLWILAQPITRESG